MKFKDIRTEEKVRLDPKCWTGKKIGNPKTKMKGGVRVNNCVPKESVAEDLPPAGYGDYSKGATKPDGTASAQRQADREFDRREYERKEQERKNKGVAEDANPNFIWIQGDFDGDTAVSGPEQGSWKDQTTKQIKLVRGRMSNVRPLSGPPPEGGKTIKQAQIPLTLDAGGQQFGTTGVDLQLTVAPNGYISKGEYGRVVGTAVVKIMRPGAANEGMAEDYNPEYDDEAGMADNNLETLKRAVEGIDDLIQTGDNLPEWCQEKIANAKSMLVAVWDYMYSEEASDEVDPEVDEMFEAMDQLAEEMSRKHRVSVDTVWETFEAMPDNVLYETAAWRRKEGKSKTGGLNAKGVASYRRENPGSKLQTAVTTKPSKLKKGSKAAKRRKSFCARMSGVKGPMKKPNGKPTRKALALRKWNC